MPRSNQTLLRAIDDVAYAQCGLVTAAQLAELGLAASTLQWRTRQGGPWRRVLPGVYLLGRGELSLVQRRIAAQLYVGAPCALTGFEALALQGVRTADQHCGVDIHLLVPRPRKRVSHGFAHVERATHWPPTRDVDGLTVATVARAAIDACRRLDRASDVRALLAEVVRDAHATIGDLERELVRSQRRRSALAREALRVLACGPVSAPEIDLFELWSASSLPEAQWNVDLVGTAGEFIARPDVYVAAAGVAVEVDSMQFHFERAAWDATMRRHARMTAYGLLVIHVPPARLRSDWPTVELEIRRAIDSRVGDVASAVRLRPVSPR